MSDPTKDSKLDKAACDDWTKIIVHCALQECGKPYLRKVKHQHYCDEHRHLAGAVIRPLEALSSNERSLLKQTADLLREMREDIFQRGTLSGRSQHAGDDLLRRIDTILITPVETTAAHGPASRAAMKELIRVSKEWRERPDALTDRPYYLLGDWIRWAEWQPGEPEEPRGVRTYTALNYVGNGPLPDCDECYKPYSAHGEMDECPPVKASGEHCKKCGEELIDGHHKPDDIPPLV